MSHVKSSDIFRMSVCRTRPLVDDFYLCQANRKDCEHAFSFGINCLCCSMERHEYSNCLV
jgi:hypothetical protein